MSKKSLLLIILAKRKSNHPAVEFCNIRLESDFCLNQNASFFRTIRKLQILKFRHFTFDPQLFLYPRGSGENNLVSRLFVRGKTSRVEGKNRLVRRLFVQGKMSRVGSPLFIRDPPRLALDPPQIPRLSMNRHFCRFSLQKSTHYKRSYLS